MIKGSILLIKLFLILTYKGLKDVTIDYRHLM